MKMYGGQQRGISISLVLPGPPETAVAIVTGRDSSVVLVGAVFVRLKYGATDFHVPKKCRSR